MTKIKKYSWWIKRGIITLSFFYLCDPQKNKRTKSYSNRKIYKIGFSWILRQKLFARKIIAFD